uniref:hypothetical protein n=1 Tax=Yoonia sp. TaxID=2212373 RepID=UPI004047F36E
QDHRSLEVRRGPHRAALRLGQVYTAHRRKPGVDGLTKVLRGAGLADNLPQYIASLFLHRSAVFGSAHAKATLHIIVEVSNRYARHRILRLHLQL